MSIVTLQAYRGYQDIGTVGQTTAQLSGNVQSINQILDVGLMNTRDLLHGFVRVEHLIGLGLATLINGNQLQSSGAGGGGTTLTASESVTITADNITLTNDTATPGNDYFYGTNGSGTRGWYALSSYSGTVTSVGIASSTLTLSGTNPITSSGTITIDTKVQLTESAGWNSSSGAIQLSLTVPQDILIPYAGTLKEVVILTQGGSGSCTVTLSKCTLGTFPGSLADITNGVPPQITSSASPYINTTLSMWTTAFAQNDVVRATLTANSTFTSVKIILRMQ